MGVAEVAMCDNNNTRSSHNSRSNSNSRSNAVTTAKDVVIISAGEHEYSLCVAQCTFTDLRNAAICRLTDKWYMLLLVSGVLGDFCLLTL